MVSRTIASLDAWLARAEEVLAEQREYAISPSLVALEGGGRYEWSTTLAALSEGLGALLGSLCCQPGRWILIIEHNGRRHLFWQALAFEDRSLCTEVISNTYLEREDRWTIEQEERLIALGWEPPHPPKRPNFINVEATTSPETGVVCRRALATLRELFDLDDEDEVFVKVFSSCIRGNTPAGPIYEVDTDNVEVEDTAARATRRHFFRPNVDASDEEMEADIRVWISGILGPASDEAIARTQSLRDRT